MRGPCEWGRHFGKGGPDPQGGNREHQMSDESGQERREDMIRGEMRRRRENKEDDPFTASGCQHAQSELMCIARR